LSGQEERSVSESHSVGEDEDENKPQAVKEEPTAVETKSTRVLEQEVQPTTLHQSTRVHRLPE